MVTQRSGDGVTRRDIIRFGGALAATSALGLSACGGGQTRGEKKQLQIGTFSSASSQFHIFEKLIKDYERDRPDVTIRLQPMPDKSFYTQLDTRLAAGDAPDIVYMQHQNVGRYAAAGSLVDISEYLDDNYGDAFFDAFWQVVDRDGKVYGIPNTTNSFALYYNKNHLKRAGIADIPTTMDDAWTWDEFTGTLRRLKAKGVTKTPFAFDWTGGNSYRWLPILYMHGGQLLDADSKQVTIDSPVGVEAIEWTRGWFTDGLVPGNTSVKSGADVSNLFSTETISIMADGAWVIPVLAERMKETDWGVTFLFQDKAKDNDLGGNTLTVSKDASDPETAADFIKFVTTENNMRYYASQAQTIPIRKGLQEETINYELQSEDMNNVFKPSAATVSTGNAAVQAQPEFGDIWTILDNELDLAFTSGQSATVTARNIAEQVREAIGS